MSDPNLPATTSISHRRKRPFSVALLASVVLILACINLLRLISSFSQSEFLQDLLPISPLYISITGLVWWVIGLVVFWFLWNGRTEARLATMTFFVAYFVFGWLERLFIARADINNWAFILLSNLIVFLWVIYIFSRRKVKVFFGDGNERRS